MDIVRDESVKKRKRQKQTAMIVVAVIAVLGATLGVSRLKPALQSVDAGTIWPDTVKRGSMLRQVRGLGSLVPIPDDVRLIPAETDVRVERIQRIYFSIVVALKHTVFSHVPGLDRPRALSSKIIPAYARPGERISAGPAGAER